jgi:hypothetical protein
MPPSATVLFVAEQDPSVAVLAAHLLALASQDRLRTAAATVMCARRSQPILRRLLAENLMPHWWLPEPLSLADLPDEIAGADFAVVLDVSLAQATRTAAPRACLTDWRTPAPPNAVASDLDNLFDWRRLYAMISQRTGLLANLSPQTLGQLHANPGATGRVLRMQGI